MSRLYVALVLLVCSVSLLGQTPDAASVRGQVLDQSRAAIAGVEIKLTNTSLGTERTARTDSSGNFSFTGLPVGTYTLTAHKDQFANLKRNLTLIAGTAADVNLQLSVSEVQTTVVVTGSAGEVRADQPQLGDRLGPEQVLETPLL